MWYIGQKVICIKDHSQGVVKKGEIYTIKGITKCVSCREVSLDIGIIYSLPTYCADCEIIISIGSRNIYSGLFKPLKEQEYKLVTFSKIVEEALISAN